MEAARRASVDDVDTIEALARNLRDELRDERGGAMWETREARTGPVVDLLGRDDACVVVGTIDGAIVGYGIVVAVVLRDGTRLGVISDLYVEPGARAVGVGEAIADALVAYCRDAACVGIDATALPGAREAKNFFERAGFTARSLTMHKRL